MNENPKRAPRGKGRSGSLIRCLRLSERLRVKRATLRELADEYTVSTRTIRRDLEALSVAGFTVRNTADAYANGFNGFWWIEAVHSPRARRAGSAPNE